MKKEIIIIGLGTGDQRQVTGEAKFYLQSDRPIFYRTLKHPAAAYFAAGKHNARSFDSLYNQSENFEEVYRAITKKLLLAVQRYQQVCYAVPGNPSVGEAAVARLRRIAPRLGIKIKIVAGLSFLEPLLNHLRLDLLDGITVLDALELLPLKEPVRGHFILAQVYNRKVASQVKLKLLEIYPADHPVVVVKAAGTGAEQSQMFPLWRLDHSSIFDHQTTLYLPPFEGSQLGDLLEIMARLRAEDGCPWDKKQTHHSLRQYLIEEAYEVLAAIDDRDDPELVEELGDLLLQVVFHCQIAREESRFSIYDVLEAITTKLIRRHPHVFGAGEAEDAAAVKVLWEEIKAGERNQKKKQAALVVDHGLPALLKAYKLQKKAAELGFDWPTVQGPLEKAEEELAELTEAYKNNDQVAIEEELGDYLFTVVNLARFFNVNPEVALGKTISKFLERFQYIMEMVEKSGKGFTDFSLQELDKWWDEAKKIRKKSR